MDRYYTPDALAEAVVAAIVKDRGDMGFDSCLEPHSGHGAFVRALRAHGAGRIVTCDVDPGAVRGDFHHEGLFEELQTVERFDLIVGNPPFSDAERQIEKALTLLKSCGLLAFLLPLQFWGSSGRAEWWSRNIPGRVQVVRPRPSFTGTGSDFREIALWTWDAEDTRTGRMRPTLDHLDWNKAARPRGARVIESTQQTETATTAAE